MAAVQVLAAQHDKKGNLKGYNVVRLEDDLNTALEDVPAGDYHVIDGTTLKRAAVSYRVVQDVDIR